MRFAPVFRSIDILMVAVLVASVVWTFKIKYDSQEAIDSVARLQKQIEAEENRVDLLKSGLELAYKPITLREISETLWRAIGIKAD